MPANSRWDLIRRLRVKEEQNKIRSWTKEWYKRRPQYTHTHTHEYFMAHLQLTDPNNYISFLLFYFSFFFRFDGPSFGRTLKTAATPTVGHSRLLPLPSDTQDCCYPYSRTLKTAATPTVGHSRLLIPLQSLKKHQHERSSQSQSAFIHCAMLFDRGSEIQKGYISINWTCLL